MRRILSDYNADRPDLFTRVGFIHLKNAAVSSSDRLVLDLLRDEWEAHNVQLQAIGKRLREFAADAPAREAEARAVLDTIPGVGFVTGDVVVSMVVESSVQDIPMFGYSILCFVVELLYLYFLLRREVEEWVFLYHAERAQQYDGIQLITYREIFDAKSSAAWRTLWPSSMSQWFDHKMDHPAALSSTRSGQ